MLYEYLIKNYIPGEPIFTGDIQIPGMTEENLRYFPKTDILGERLSLSADTVAVHKYIMRRGRRVGYYSGYTLANRMGLSVQVPYTQEISSNFAPAAVRKIMIKNRPYIIRRPVAEVTEENVSVLQFLDCSDRICQKERHYQEEDRSVYSEVSC